MDSSREACAAAACCARASAGERGALVAGAVVTEAMPPLAPTACEEEDEGGAIAGAEGTTKSQLVLPPSKTAGCCWKPSIDEGVNSHGDARTPPFPLLLPGAAAIPLLLLLPLISSLDMAANDLRRPPKLTPAVVNEGACWKKGK